MLCIARISAVAICLAISASAQDPVSVGLILQEGDVPPGETDPVSILNAPFVNALGQVGFVGGLDNDISDRFIWIEDGIVWKNSDALPIVLTGAEGTMGISDDGGFIYSPTVDGNDAVWTHDGLLLQKTDPIPGVPEMFSSFNSRPQMIPDGTASWVGGLTDTPTGSTQARALFRASDTSTPTIEIVIQSGDVIDGFPIDSPSGVEFTYDFSDDGLHHIHDLTMDTGSSSDDEFVYVDGALEVRESEATGDGDNWANFDLMSINDQGNYVFSGDTDGNTAMDEFIAYNGAIVLREGDLVGGVELASSASVNGLSINNNGEIVHLWNTSGGVELLFFSQDAANPADGVLLLATGDEVDFDDDGVGDATVADFNASAGIGPGINLGTSGQMFAEVDLAYGEDELEAIVSLDIPGSIGSESDPGDFHLSKVVPNPAVYSTALVLRLDQTQTVSVRVFDTLGRAVAAVDGGWRAADEEIRLEVDTSTLAPGMYVIHVEGETFSETRRFTVVR